MATTQSVAIVGAGMAGASAAAALHKAGLAVTLFEKSRGPSGRMSTRRTDSWQADHGAQYFTAESPDFQEEVKLWCNKGWAALWEGRIARLSFNSSADWGAKSLPNKQLPFEPTRPKPRYVGSPRMTAIAAGLVEPVNLVTQTTISGAVRHENQWRLHCKEHGELPQSFDMLVWAIPQPQLQPFEKLFPAEWNQAINNCQFAPCWAVMAGYDRPLKLPFDGLFVGSPEDQAQGHSPLAWVARTLSKPGRTGEETWTLHASHAFTRDHLQATPEDMADHLTQAFSQLGAPQPTWALAHRWLYALAESKSALRPVCLWDTPTGLGICGDWLADGRVEGAWQSGTSLARQVLQSPK
jgi:predicted NAD/FAD-dependent oxidoreductase